MIFSRSDNQPVQAECRYCLETDLQTNLLSPCICKGSFQYVHQQCLQTWYQASPDKGLHCSACGTRLARTFSHELEHNPVQFPWIVFSLQNPLVLVLYVHAVFLLLYILTLRTTIQSQVLYTFVQSIFHGLQFGKMVALVSYIHNQTGYWKLWISSRRILLPIIHSYILYGMGTTYLIGGISADICMCVYFYEHIAIVHTMNDQRTFVFTNRLEWLEQLEQ